MTRHLPSGVEILVAFLLGLLLALLIAATGSGMALPTVEEVES